MSNDENRFEADDDYDGRENLFSGKPIAEDRFYYRDDFEQIKNIVDNAKPVRVFVGLRRYGKSSFLRRIERHCNGSNDEYDPDRAHHKNVKAYYIGPDVGGMKTIGGRIDKGLSEQIQGGAKKIFLLDDLQIIGALYERSKEKSALDAALNPLFAQAEKCGTTGVNVVLAEPTSHFEWLGGSQMRGVEPVVQRFRHYMGRLVQRPAPAPGPTFYKMSAGLLRTTDGEIPTLDIDQARALLTGSPPEAKGYSGRRFRLTEAVVARLHQAFGGNPWFLAAAHRELAERRDPSMLRQDELAKLVADVNSRLEEDGEGLKTIYAALTSVERLIVEVLHGAYAENEDAIALLDNPRRLWDPDKAAEIIRLDRLGLINMNDGYPTALKSESFARAVGKALNNHSIFEMPSMIEPRLWDQVFIAPHPEEQKRSKAVIHQLSDIFFDDSGESNDYWEKYLQWLKNLRDTKAPSQPHFLVICGNLLPGAIEEGHIDPAGARYRDLLDCAFERIAEAVPFLKPLLNGEDARSQVIVLPGVLDLRWEAENARPSEKLAAIRRKYRRLWDERVRAYRFSPRPSMSEEGDDESRMSFAPVHFDAARIAFVPFDSVSVEGINHQLGREAVIEVADIRRRIRSQFVKDWLALRNDNPESSLSETWERFLRHTWRYIIVDQPATEGESGVIPEHIDVATFKWRQQVEIHAGCGNAPDRSEEETWLSETGTVAAAAIRYAEEELAKHDRAQPMLRIGVMHHCPQTRRQATLVEFVEAYRCRQRLAQIGVRYVLHGHLSRQHFITETVTYPGGGKDEPPQQINLISAGTFSDLFGTVPQGVSEVLDDQPIGPTFNVIEISPPSRLAGDNEDFQLDVQFHYWPDGAKGFPQGYLTNNTP